MEMPNKADRTCAKIMFNRPPSRVNHAMAIDPGYNNNSFAIVTGYWSEDDNMPIIDGMVEIIPLDHNIPISFNSAFVDVMCLIIEHMNVKLIITDRWQNIKFLSDLENRYNIEQEIYSPKYKIMQEFKSQLEVAELQIPNIECKWKEIEKLAGEEYPMGYYQKPVAHFIYQLLTVQDLGKDVVKGDGTTDDLFRAVIGFYAYAIDDNWRDLLSGSNDSKIPQAALGAVASPANRNVGGIGGSNSSSGIGTVVSRR
jgi:hypothetical protein